MRNDLIIRQFDRENREDYRAMARLYGYAYPDEQADPMLLKLSDQVRERKFTCERYLCESNGVIAGIGCFEHWESFYHPRKYLIHVIVTPEYQRQGIGYDLYRYTLKNLEKLNPREVQTWVRSDRNRSVRFAEARGFTKTNLRWNLVLDLSSFNPEPFAGLINAILDQHIEIKLLSELVDDFESNRKFYDLYVKTLKSIEAAGKVEVPGYDDYILKKNQNAYEMTFVAVHNNRYVGMWQLESVGAGTSLFGGAMGVEESYRQSGIAYALTVHGIIFAKRHHYDSITAHTDEHNRAILKLTRKLGFIQLPAQLLFSKTWANE